MSGAGFCFREAPARRFAVSGSRSAAPFRFLDSVADSAKDSAAGPEVDERPEGLRGE